MHSIERSFVLKTLTKSGFSARSIQLGIDSQTEQTPFIIFDHTTYPGVEAHLFTVADASLWLPAFTSSGDVVLYRPNEQDVNQDSSSLKKRIEAWQELLVAIVEISNLLKPYKTRLEQGWIPRIIWAHHESEWHHGLRDAPDHEVRPISEFLDYVDPSIRPCICELNECGFITKESCSGLLDEHPDRDPYRPYVMFDDRVYVGMSSHLFTLADIGQWIPSYGPHGFDVVVRQQLGDYNEIAWNRLIDVARQLSPLISNYQILIKDDKSLIGHKRKRYEVLSDTTIELFSDSCCK
ncbi:MAG: hypothetical protein RTU30_08035 [Candidatus Thorarchaeota archaeon]